MEILFYDKDLAVVVKPVGIESQEAVFLRLLLEIKSVMLNV